MQDLKVTLVQTNQVWENVKANLSHYESIFKDLEKTDLILLPEMFNTSFSMNTSLAEKWGKSTSFEWLRTHAQKLDSAIYTSLMIEENGLYYNRGVFVFPDGSHEIYDKRKTFGLAGEDKVISNGNRRVIVEYKEWKFLLQICYDLRFPEISRNALTNGEAEYDVILYVANWPEKRVKHWSMLLPARAIENQCYVCALNRIGVDGNKIEYNGQSVVYNGNGELVLNSAADVEALNFNLTRLGLTTLRKKLPFLMDK